MQLKVVDFNNNRTNKGSYLDAWLAECSLKQVHELTIDDLCRMVRQELTNSQIENRIINELENDIMLGNQYDGEMIYSLAERDSEFWLTRNEFARKLKPILMDKMKLLSEEDSKYAMKLIEQANC